MKVGIAADHGGFEMKLQISNLLRVEGYEVVDFGNTRYDRNDDYPDFTIPRARAIATGFVERGILLCGSGIGASVAANNIRGVRAAVCHDDFSARQGVENDNMNVLCLGGRTTGIAVAWDCVKSFLRAKFSGEVRYCRRLAKVEALRGAPIITVGVPPAQIARLSPMAKSAEPPLNESE